MICCCFFEVVGGDAGEGLTRDGCHWVAISDMGGGGWVKWECVFVKGLLRGGAMPPWLGG